MIYLTTSTAGMPIRPGREGASGDANIWGISPSIPDIIPSLFIYHSPFCQPRHTKKLTDMASQHPIVAASAKYPKPTEHTFQYGTAGVGFQSDQKNQPNLADTILL